MNPSGIRTKTICKLFFTFVIFACLSETVQAGCLKGAVVSGGEVHTLVLMADKNSTVWACGDNYYLQLGIGDDYSDQTTLTQVLGGDMDSDILKNIADVDAGWKHSLALDNDGYLWAWGDNEKGQLGDNSIVPRSTPVQVLSGEQSDEPCGYLKDIVDISAGRSGEHSLAVSSDGFCWAWGRDSSGQVGDGSSNNGPHKVPTQVHGVGDVGELENIVAVSGGQMFSMALEDPNEGGRVFTFGEDDVGQLGNGGGEGDDNQSAPVIVLKGQQPSSSAYLENIVAISAGWDNAMALDAEGYVYCWGYGKDGQLGDGYTKDRYEPVRVLKGEQQDPCDPCNLHLHHIVAISAGEGSDYLSLKGYAMALDSNRNVWTWGSDEYGQLGNGPGKNDSTTPVKVVGGQMGTEYLENIVAISAGYWHCLAIDANGVIWSWGMDGDGQLGNDDDREDKHVPQRMACIPDFSLTKLDDAGDCVSPRDGQITYTINYDYQADEEWEPEPAYFESILIYDHLESVDFISAAPPGTDTDGTVIWSIDPNFFDPNSVELVVQVNKKVAPGGMVENFAEIIATLGEKQYIYHEIIETPVCDCDGLGQILYVDKYASDPCDGSSWTKAFQYLQDALDVAWPCDEVWVAAETYKPTEDPCETDATFQMVSGVAVYGGFLGYEEQRYERNWFDNETILNGDINGSVSVEYVVSNNSDAQVSVLDGFTITNGDIAAVYCEDASPIIQHNKITGSGTAVYCFESEEPVIKNNWIYENDNGIYFDEPDDVPTIRNNTVAYNTEYGISGSCIDPNISISNCVIWGNGTQLNLDFVPTYSCIQNWTQSGTGNISSNPSFVSAATDNYLLEVTSPCIDAGDPCGNYGSEREIDKHFRVLDGNGDEEKRVDMGADEYCNQGDENDADFNEDGIVDTNDLVELAGVWLTDSNDPAWDEKYDLYDDQVIDYIDFAYFAKEWLWMTCDKMQGYEMMEMMMGMGGGMGRMAGDESQQSYREPTIEEQIIAQIKEALNRIEEEGVKTQADEDVWLCLLTSLEKWLKELEQD